VAAHRTFEKQSTGLEAQNQIVTTDATEKTVGSTGSVAGQLMALTPPRADGRLRDVARNGMPTANRVQKHQDTDGSRVNRKANDGPE
jgi:hypothetical protein